MVWGVKLVRPKYELDSDFSREFYRKENNVTSTHKLRNLKKFTKKMLCQIKHFIFMQWKILKLININSLLKLLYYIVVLKIKLK